MAPKATKPPAGPIPPGPIQERLAAYTEGDRKIAAIVKIQADLIERQAAINVLTNEFCALEATLPGYRDRTDEQWAQLRAISDKVDALAKALDPLRKSAERRIAAVLAVPKAMRLITKNTSMAELRRDQRKAAKDGVDWLHKATAADAEVGTDGKPLWTVWHQIDRKREQRAYHSGRTLTLDGREERMSIIALSNRSPRRTAIHELGHALEHQLPTVNARAVEFAAYRIGDEPFSKMALLFPGHGYGEHEQGRKDKFDQAFDRNSAYYIGKSYAGNSEVVSMGIEKLSVDPVGFAKNDPEFCKFILGILDGALR